MTETTSPKEPAKLEDLAKSLLGFGVRCMLTSEPMPEGFDPRGNAWRCMLYIDETSSNAETAPLFKSFHQYKDGRKEQVFASKRRVISLRYYTGSGILTVPTALEVLDSCLKDARCVRWESFEGFCSEFGLDTDSRKARKTYKACASMARKLQKFLGERFEDFLDAEGL